jgi:hypothetical protein
LQEAAISNGVSVCITRELSACFCWCSPLPLFNSKHSNRHDGCAVKWPGASHFTASKQQLPPPTDARKRGCDFRITRTYFVHCFHCASMLYANDTNIEVVCCIKEQLLKGQTELARSMDTILTARKDGLKAQEDHKKQFRDLKDLFCSFLSELLLEIADLKEISSKTDAPPPRAAPASKKDSDDAARYGEAKAVVSWLPTSSNCGLNDHQESNAAAAQRVMMWLPDREQAKDNEKERTMSLLAAAQRGPAVAKVVILAKIRQCLFVCVGVVR